MIPYPTAAKAAIGLAAATLVLTSCTSPEKPQRSAVPKPATEAGGEPQSRTVWRLRAGLNVAALSCRGTARAPVAASYSRMLTRHSGLLSTSYRREIERQGGAAFDREQTRVYNHFAHQRSPASFCRTAAKVAERASAIDSRSLSPAAPRLLAQLEDGLR